MLREFRDALVACVLTFALCAVASPAIVYAIGHTVFRHQADGSLIVRDGKVIGSERIAQAFASDKYFTPRPSAAGADGYAADAASGSNLATKNPARREAIEGRAKALGATLDNPVPADLVTASGSGLDPDASTCSWRTSIGPRRKLRRQRPGSLARPRLRTRRPCPRGRSPRGRS